MRLSAHTLFTHVHTVFRKEFEIAGYGYVKREDMREVISHEIISSLFIIYTLGDGVHTAFHLLELIH